jgi:hypothetical protein
MDALISLYILNRALQLGIPRVGVARMVLNVSIEGLLGAAPFLGDLFDVVFKANRRNYVLLNSYLAQPRRAAWNGLAIPAGHPACRDCCGSAADLVLELAHPSFGVMPSQTPVRLLKISTRRLAGHAAASSSSASWLVKSSVPCVFGAAFAEAWKVKLLSASMVNAFICSPCQRLGRAVTTVIPLVRRNIKQILRMVLKKFRLMEVNRGKGGVVPFSMDPTKRAE